MWAVIVVARSLSRRARRQFEYYVCVENIACCVR
jgi:hypothetical protein